MVSEAMQVSQDAEERVMQKAVWGAFVHYVPTKQAVPSLNSFLKRKAFRFCRVAASRFIYFSSFFLDSLCPSFLSSPCTSISAFSFRGALVSDLYHKRQLTVFSMVSRIF